MRLNSIIILLFLNLDEYTRITTPRQDVLFKKGYLSRPKKYDTQITTNSSSSAGSGAVSVVSTEEYGSHFSNQSISPETCTIPPYPTDGFESEYPLMYPPGFFDQNGYFYRKWNSFMILIKSSSFILTDYICMSVECLLFISIFHFVQSLNTRYRSLRWFINDNALQ